MSRIPLPEMPDSHPGPPGWQHAASCNSLPRSTLYRWRCAAFKQWDNLCDKSAWRLWPSLSLSLSLPADHVFRRQAPPVRPLPRPHVPRQRTGSHALRQVSSPPPLPPSVPLRTFSRPPRVSSMISTAGSLVMLATRKAIVDPGSPTPTTVGPPGLNFPLLPNGQRQPVRTHGRAAQPSVSHRQPMAGFSIPSWRGRRMGGGHGNWSAFRPTTRSPTWSHSRARPGRSRIASQGLHVSQDCGSLAPLQLPSSWRSASLRALETRIPTR